MSRTQKRTGPPQRLYQHRRLRRQRRRQIVITVIAAVAILLISIVSFVYSKYRLMNKAEIDIEQVTNPYINPSVRKVMEGYTTFAIFGIDARNNNSLGKGNLSDVIMICNIDNATGEIRLVSVYRDTYLDINGKEDFRKINAAYLNGGPQQALLALNQNLDFNITKYVTFNWKSVADVINILGGIDVEITKEEYGNGTTTGINGFIQATKEATGIDSMHLKGPGPQHLDGVQAVAYSRLRLMDTDFQRTQRQRKVIALCMGKAKQADLGMLVDSIDAVFPYIMTNFSTTEIITMVKNIPDYHMGDSTGFPTKLKSQRIGKQGLCEVPVDLAEDVTILHEFLFNNQEYTVSSNVLKLTKTIQQRSTAADTEAEIAAKKAAAAATTEAEETTSAKTTDSQTSLTGTSPNQTLPKGTSTAADNENPTTPSGTGSEASAGQTTANPTNEGDAPAVPVLPTESGTRPEESSPYESSPYESSPAETKTGPQSTDSTTAAPRNPTRNSNPTQKPESPTQAPGPGTTTTSPIQPTTVAPTQSTSGPSGTNGPGAVGLGD